MHPGNGFLQPDPAQAEAVAQHRHQAGHNGHAEHQPGNRLADANDQALNNAGQFQHTIHRRSKVSLWERGHPALPGSVHRGYRCADPQGTRWETRASRPRRGLEALVPSKGSPCSQQRKPLFPAKDALVPRRPRRRCKALLPRCHGAVRAARRSATAAPGR